MFCEYYFSLKNKIMAFDKFKRLKQLMQEEINENPPFLLLQLIVNMMNQVEKEAYDYDQENIMNINLFQNDNTD